MDTLIRCVGVLRVTLYSGERVKCVNFEHLKRSVKLRLSFCSANLQDDYIMFSAQHNPSRLRGKKKKGDYMCLMLLIKLNSLSFVNFCLKKEASALLCVPKLKGEPWVFFPPSTAIQLLSAPMPSPEVALQFFPLHLHPERAPSLKTNLFFFFMVWWRAKRCTPVSSPVALHVNASYNVSNNSAAVASSNCDPSSISGSARR